MLILVTGGCRSGKSALAMRLAARGEAPRTFLATAQVFDDEMASRVARHRASRPADWGLVEEPLRVPEALAEALRGARTVLLDCVTLWISNLLCAEETLTEDAATARAEALAAAARAGGGTVVAVTNEVGWGVVPATPLGRAFRDCAGRANQVLAREADEVWMAVSGLALPLKTPQGGLAHA
jgi:adenosylcobinamide kinase / adenosylcobinamide-phosphate guanylyltransferase